MKDNFTLAVIIIPIVFNVVELIIIWICGMIDPGIMNRNKFCIRGDDTPIKLVHKGFYKETKICHTCNIVKPFKSHHCHDCGNCIYNFDHHCPWIGGCIGGRNYIYFFAFVCLLNIKNIFIAVFCIIHIIYSYKDIKSEEKKDKWIALNLINLIPTLLTMIFLGLTMFFTVGLNIYHIKLISRGMSTKDDIKKLIFDKVGNPYDRGCSKNCSDFWTRHKKYEKSYTVKDLRAKTIIMKSNNRTNTQLINSTNTPLIMPYGYSKKEMELMNKSKNKNLSNENTNLEANNEGNNNINNNNNNINNNKIETNDKINNENIEKEKENKEENKNEIEKEKETEQIISERGENINQKLINEQPVKEDILSIGKISDENDNYKTKVCNTSVKKNSNLNKINDIEIVETENKNILKEKNSILDKEEDQGYQIARKRLEELSSEITINQEMQSSMSIPNENSINSSLNQAE